MTALLLLALGQDWPTYHGGYALDGVTETAPPDAPVLLWRYKAGARVHSTPLVAEGRVYTAHSKGGIAALGLDGRELWSAKLGENEDFKAPLLYVGGVLVMGSGAGRLYALDAASGKPKWTYELGESVQGSANRVELPGGKSGVIALSQSDGVLHGLDMDGKLLWKTPPFERCDGSPSALGGRAVLGSCASALHVYDVAKPGKPGDIELGGDSQVAGGVALSGAQAFAGTRGGKLVAADIAAGKVLWSNGDRKGEAFSTPAVGAKVVVFAADDGHVSAVERATGKTLWSVDTGGSPTSPVIAGNRVVVTSSGTLLIYDLENGKKIASAEISDDATSPAVAGGVIYVGADDGSVVAYGRKAP